MLASVEVAPLAADIVEDEVDGTVVELPLSVIVLLVVADVPALVGSSWRLHPTASAQAPAINSAREGDGMRFIQFSSK